MPNHVQSPRSVPFLVKEYELFKESLENWLGKKIEDEAIKDAVDVFNTNRRLMHKVNELRQGENPPLTGEEAMELVLSSQMVDKREHNTALEELLAKLGERVVNRPIGTRLMILGSEDDDIEFLNMVESSGATFVIDEHCTGTRYFWNEVESNGGDLLESLANRYIKRPPCPSKDWPERTRTDHVLRLAKDYDVAGAIIMQQKFCDPHEIDVPALTKALNDAGVKTLFLEFDVTVPIGQFKVRVEAFLEMLEQEDLFSDDDDLF
jgi:benzoyl-CoA reductase subunit C